MQAMRQKHLRNTEGEASMKATNKLRFVERDNGIRTALILQQWWEDSYVTLAVHITDKDGNTLPSPNRGEWRDVPVEKQNEM
jgi:hypothetical protein